MINLFSISYSSNLLISLYLTRWSYNINNTLQNMHRMYKTRNIRLHKVDSFLNVGHMRLHFYDFLQLFRDLSEFLDAFRFFVPVGCGFFGLRQVVFLRHFFCLFLMESDRLFLTIATFFCLILVSSTGLRLHLWDGLIQGDIRQSLCLWVCLLIERRFFFYWKSCLW